MGVISVLLQKPVSSRSRGRASFQTCPAIPEHLSTLTGSGSLPLEGEGRGKSSPSSQARDSTHFFGEAGGSQSPQGSSLGSQSLVSGLSACTQMLAAGLTLGGPGHVA